MQRTRKVLDGAHAWPATGSAKNKAAILVTGGPGGTFGMDFIDYMGWVYNGGGFDLITEFYQKELKLNVVWLRCCRPVHRHSVVQAADQEPRRLQRHEMPPDRHGR